MNNVIGIQGNEQMAMDLNRIGWHIANVLQQYTKEMNLPDVVVFNTLGINLIMSLWDRYNQFILANWICPKNIFFWNIHLLRQLETALWEFGKLKTACINNLIFFPKLANVIKWDQGCPQHNCGFCNYHQYLQNNHVCIYTYITGNSLQYL